MREAGAVGEEYIEEVAEVSVNAAPVFDGEAVTAGGEYADVDAEGGGKVRCQRQNSPGGPERGPVDDEFDVGALNLVGRVF